MNTTYRRGAPNVDRTIDPGIVVQWQDGFVFQCPCNERTVYVATPPHRADFDVDRVLTLKGSVGYPGSKDRPKNWCHFSIRNGEARIHKDAKCPGADLAASDEGEET